MSGLIGLGTDQAGRRVVPIGSPMSDRTFSLPVRPNEPAQPAGDGPRPFIQVWFECSGQYQKVFRNRAGTGYLARCPACGKSIRFRVGAGGTGQRAFRVSC